MTEDERIKWLMNVIIFHKKLYYSGNAKLDDKTFDMYEDDLRARDPNNPVLDLVGYSDDYEKYFTKDQWYSTKLPFYKGIL